MTPLAAAIEKDEAAAEPRTYVHATALAVGEAGVLIRGRSGAGKSRLALDLIAEARRRGLFARLAADDRVALHSRGGRLIARNHPTIAGRIESRGEGILELGHEPAIVIRLVIDLDGGVSAAPERMPQVEATRVFLRDVELPRLSLQGPGPSQAGIVIDHLLRMGNG
jgi:serine kinase of HPr protein (carbohydrate metabolism regulator)